MGLDLLRFCLLLHFFAQQGRNMDTFELIGGAMVGDDEVASSSTNLILHRVSRWACPPCEQI